MKKTYFLCCFLFSLSAFAQEKKLSLTDMSDFKPQAGNWFVVGEVSIDPTIDIHEQPAKGVVETGKKKKNTVPEAPKPKAVEYKAGTGILLNLNDESKKSNLITAFEHGDIELELEVMLPKGSNSGIYLQGRYEVQLFDSWGVKNPAFSDLGGIYRNWETETDKIYMGKAPLTNAAKAPGLWQKIKIDFRAPRFDAAGSKIANAKFVSVSINGVKIHDNVEVPLPTGGPIENNEKAIGPLMIQGDHGPVAFRNIRYQINSEQDLKTSPIAYRVHKGNFKDVAEFTATAPTKTGTVDKVTFEVSDDLDGFGITYSGFLTVPKDDAYQFFLRFTGGAVLQVNGQTIIDVQRPDEPQNEKGSIDLKQGTYPFTIHYYKFSPTRPPLIGFLVKTAQSYPLVLNSYNSNPPESDPASPILINPTYEPKLLRAFVDFKGNRKKRITHSIGVGDPSGTHYVYDLDAGNLVCVWRGNFVDATPMWHDRGDGSFKPLGAVQFLFLNQPLAFLNQPTDPFPVTGIEGEFRSKGYRIDAAGRPVFIYLYKGIEVEEKLYPDNENRVITREITVKNREGKAGLYFKLAEGSRIDQMPDGSFAIDDRQYYVKPLQPASIREVNGLKELVIAVDGNSIKYSIIW